MQSLISEKSEISNNISKNKQSIPIKIVNSNLTYNYDVDFENKNENNDEYILNKNIFNPSKMSPPNDWKNRLENRIRIYFSVESELNIEKYR